MSGEMTNCPLGLRWSEASQEFVVADAGGGVEVGHLLDFRADRRRDVARQWNTLDVLGDIEIGLVKRQRLDDCGVLGEDLADLKADRLIDLEARPHEDQVRTLTFSGHRRHRRADPELPRFVAGGGDDAAFRGPAYGDRLAAKLRIVPLLDRRVEGVHVDVDYLAVRRRRDVLLRIGRGHGRIL
jgi:hypothetical protein